MDPRPSPLLSIFYCVMSIDVFLNVNNSYTLRSKAYKHSRRPRLCHCRTTTIYALANIFNITTKTLRKRLSINTLLALLYIHENPRIEHKAPSFRLRRSLSQNRKHSTHILNILHTTIYRLSLLKHQAPPLIRIPFQQCPHLIKNILIRHLLPPFPLISPPTSLTLPTPTLSMLRPEIETLCSHDKITRATACLYRAPFFASIVFTVAVRTAEICRITEKVSVGCGAVIFEEGEEEWCGSGFE